MNRARMTRRLGTVLALILSLALLAACGRSQPAAPPDQPAPAASTGGTEQPPAPAADSGSIPVGFLAGWTGAMAPWTQDEYNGILLALEQINAAGGPLGRPIQIFNEDNESGPEGAIRGARKLLTANNVVAIIGPESDPMMALLDFAKENKLPIISGAGGTTGLNTAGGTERYIYRTTAGDSFLGAVEAHLMYNVLGIKEVAIMHENTEGVTSAAESFQANFEALGGRVLDTAVLNVGQATYQAEMRKIFSANPPMVYLAASDVTGVALLKEKYQRGYKTPIWTSSDLQTPDIIAAAGPEVVEGVRSQRVVEDDASQAWQLFAPAFQAKFGQEPTPGYYQSNHYDALMLVALAIEAAGEATGEKVNARLAEVANPPGEVVYTFEDGARALRDGKDINFEGTAGPQNFNEYGNVSAGNAATMIVQNGQWVIEAKHDVSKVTPVN